MTTKQIEAIAKLPALLSSLRAAQAAFVNATTCDMAAYGAAKRSADEAKEALDKAIDTAIASVPSSKGYRNASVNGRRFSLMAVNGRCGVRGERRSYTKWVVTERSDDGKMVASVSDGAASLAAAHRAIAKFCGLLGGSE